MDDEYKDQTNVADPKESKKQYLYYELLRLVDAQAHKQLNTLEGDLRLLSDKRQDEWKRLTTFDVAQQYEEARQDVIPNGIEAKYSYQQLSEEGASSSSFNGHTFYDQNEYLPQLILLAQIVDDEFQKSVQKIFNVDKKSKVGRIMRYTLNVDEQKTTDDGDGIVHYMRGPVKLMERARSKAENDYFASKYPKSACVLDLNRCSLVFNDISTLLSALEIFRKKIEYYQSGSIIGIVRSKNGFTQYMEQTQYADIKLNVIIKGKRNNIIGEVQFLLRTMLEYKKKAHNLYSIQRQRDHIETSSSILPILLDQNTQLFVAGNMGDVKSLCGMMIILNKSEKDIMTVDAESKESILLNIVALGKYKAFRFLYSAISRDLFINRLFLANRYDQNAVEEAVKSNHVLLTDVILSIKEVKERYATDNNLKYRLLWWLFGFASDETIDYVLKELEITPDVMKTFLNYNYKDPSFIPSNKQVILKYAQPILYTAQLNQKSENSFGKIASVIGADAFCDAVFKGKYRGINVLENVIIGWELKMIKFILSFDAIKNKYLNDKDMFWRLIYWIFAKGTEDIINFVLNAFNISKQQIVYFMEYKYTQDTEAQAATSYKHENIAYSMIMHNTLHATKIMVSIIEEETFCKFALHDHEVTDVNSVEVSILRKKWEILKYFMTLKDIKHQYSNDTTMRFRLLMRVFGSADEDIIDYICNELNISNEEIIQFIELDGAKVWNEIIQRNGLNILKKLASIIGEKVFIESVLTPSCGNINIIEMSIRCNKLETIEYMLSFAEIKNKYLNDLDLLYRSVFWLFVDPDASDELIDYFMAELNISHDQMVKFINYHYTTEPLLSFDNSHWDYAKETMLCRMGLMSNVNKLKKLVSVIGEKAFIFHIFVCDARDMNAIEYCIRKNSLEMIKYIMSFDEIKTKCANDEQLLYEILGTLMVLKQQHHNTETMQYVIEILDIDMKALLMKQVN